jgi:hypothetical protein
MTGWTDDSAFFTMAALLRNSLNTRLSLLHTTHSTIPLAARTEIPLLLLLQIQALHADTLASL